MTSPTREQIVTALFNLVSGAVYLNTSTPVFLSSSRKLKLWGEVPAGQRPALFVAEHGESHVQKMQGLPTIRTLAVKLYIYTNARDKSVTPDTAINNIIDAIDSVTGGVLKPDTARGTLTLGGLVQHCWIEGEIFKDPGDLDGDGMIVIPVKILIP